MGRQDIVRIMNIVILILSLLLFYYRIKRRSLHHFHESTEHNHVMVECAFMYEQWNARHKSVIANSAQICYIRLNQLFIFCCFYWSCLSISVIKHWNGWIPKYQEFVSGGLSNLYRPWSCRNIFIINLCKFFLTCFRFSWSLRRNTWPWLSAPMAVGCIYAIFRLESAKFFHFPVCDVLPLAYVSVSSEIALYEVSITYGYTLLDLN